MLEIESQKSKYKMQSRLYFINIFYMIQAGKGNIIVIDKSDKHFFLVIEHLVRLPSKQSKFVLNWTANHTEPDKYSWPHIPLGMLTALGLDHHLIALSDFQCIDLQNSFLVSSEPCKWRRSVSLMNPSLVSLVCLQLNIV